MIHSDVLFLDDDHNDQTLMSLHMRGVELSYGLAFTGDQALKVMRHYRTLVTDLHLGPGMNGLAVAKAFKSAHPERLVVLLSGQDNVTSSDVVLSLLKPTNMGVLIQRLKDHVRVARAGREPSKSEESK